MNRTELRRSSHAFSLAMAALAAAAAMGQSAPPSGSRGGGPGGSGGPGGPGGPMAEERQILKQFDKDENGRLEGAERDAARAELKRTPQRGPGGMRGPGGARAETKPGPKVSPAEVQSYPDAPLFSPDVVRTVFLDFDLENWEEELELFHNTDADVPATMTVDGKTYKGVGVHFRGASSYMMVPRGTKRSFNIAVDHTEPDARLYGQNTLNLINSNGDASMMSAVLYSHLARGHIAAPRANFVQVVVNGESWGVFVSVEQFNKAFLRDRWPELDGSGARWKVKGSPRATGGLDYRGSGLAAYRERYEIKSKDSKEDWQALVKICKVLSETPLDRLEQELAPILDIEGALWFLALDVASANTDGYWIRASDYSLYRDPKGVFHLVPHDMNEAFKLSHGGPPGGFGGPPGDFGGPPDGFGGPDPNRGAIRSRGMRPQPGPRPEDRKPETAPGVVRGPDAQDAPPREFDRDEPPMRPDFRGPSDASESLAELDPLVGVDDLTKPLRSRLLAVPSLRARYLAHVQALAREMEWSAIGPVVARQRALIAELVAKDTRKATPTAAFERATADAGPGGLREFFEKRSRYLLAYQPKAADAAPTPAKDQNRKDPAAGASPGEKHDRR